MAEISIAMWMDSKKNVDLGKITHHWRSLEHEDYNNRKKEKTMEKYIYV